MVSYVEISQDFMDNILKLEIDYVEKMESIILWVVRTDDIDKDSFASVNEDGSLFYAIDYTKSDDYIELIDVYEINSDEYLDFINKNKYIVNNFNE